MTVTLPTENMRWPRFRLLTRASWGGNVTSGGAWQVRPMQNNTPYSSGFILGNYTRCLLPQLGTAEIIFRFGEFSGRIVGMDAPSALLSRQGSPWSPATSSLDLPDLTGQEIRIQVAYPDADDVVEDDAWVTCWWGTCEYQIDVGWGAATVPSGERTYYCVDAFARTKRWFMDRHGFISSAGTIAPAAGHPGYNVSRQSPSQVAGNKDSTASTWDANGDGVTGRKFTMPGAGDAWTDAEAVNEALTNHRTPGEPHWVLGGTAFALFSTSSPWPVQDGDTVFDVVTRICRRQRGRGAVLPSWTESSPTGPLTCTLLAFAQMLGNITYDDPAASQVTLNGATTNGTAIAVDVIGDHRFSPGSLQLGDPQQYVVDYLVTQGEPIEVLGTVEHSLTLEPGWEAGEEADFIALDAENRIDERWKPVFQLHRLKRGFQMNLANGNGSGQASADYRCTDAGVPTATNQPNSIGNSSASMIEVMDDLPLYEGYTYVGGPARADGQTAAAFSGTPARRNPLILIKTASDRYLRAEQLAKGPQFKLTPDGILIQFGDDQGTGERFIGDTDEGSAYDYDQVVLTLGFRLPHRVRMATGNPTGRRRLILTHPNIHFWLAASTAIWDIDSENADSDGSPGKRTAGGASPGILRDDRSALARLHALAVAWYRPKLPGQDPTIIRNASWSLRCCADVPTGEDYDGGGITYPTLGKVVTELSANGQILTLNTIVSTISYDNSNGETTWTTDWQDLDLTNG